MLYVAVFEYHDKPDKQGKRALHIHGVANHSAMKLEESGKNTKINLDIGIKSITLRTGSLDLRPLCTCMGAEIKLLNISVSMSENPTVRLVGVGICIAII